MVVLPIKEQHIPPRLPKFLFDLDNFENPWKISAFLEAQNTAHNHFNLPLLFWHCHKKQTFRKKNIENSQYTSSHRFASQSNIQYNSAHNKI